MLEEIIDRARRSTECLKMRNQSRTGERRRKPLKAKKNKRAKSCADKEKEKEKREQLLTSSTS